MFNEHWFVMEFLDPTAALEARRKEAMDRLDRLMATRNAAARLTRERAWRVLRRARLTKFGVEVTA